MLTAMRDNETLIHQTEFQQQKVKSRQNIYGLHTSTDHFVKFTDSSHSMSYFSFLPFVIVYALFSLSNLDKLIYKTEKNPK